MYLPFKGLRRLCLYKYILGWCIPKDLAAEETEGYIVLVFVTTSVTSNFCEQLCIPISLRLSEISLKVYLLKTGYQINIILNISFIYSQ